MGPGGTTATRIRIRTASAVSPPSTGDNPDSRPGSPPESVRYSGVQWGAALKSPSTTPIW
jgi:hypothetical protein